MISELSTSTWKSVSSPTRIVESLGRFESGSDTSAVSPSAASPVVTSIAISMPGVIGPGGCRLGAGSPAWSIVKGSALSCIAVAVVGVSEAFAGALTTAVGGGGVFLLLVPAIGTKSSIMSGTLVSSVGSSAASSSMPGTANAVMSGSRTVGFTLLPTEPSSCHGNVSTCLY